MRVIQVFNRRQAWGGEDNSITDTVEMLQSRGIETYLWTKDVAELGGGLRGKMSAATSGIHSFRAAKEMNELIDSFRPDVVHAHNIYPQLSPAIFSVCRSRNVPVVWHPHDQRPICPTGLHLCQGRVCERCCGGREYWCVLKNCRGNILESAAYALRTYTARRSRVFHKCVTRFVVWSHFLKERLASGGFDPDRITVLPHPVRMPERVPAAAKKDYVAYIGRISPEKGVDTLLSAARALPDIPFRIAGDPKRMPALVKEVPGNVEFVGWCDRARLESLLGGARLMVIPSVCFEVFPTVALEALSCEVPVIGAKTGGIPEVVVEGSTGLLFRPGDPVELAQKIQYLFERPELCHEMGQAGRAAVQANYLENNYFESLMQVYRDATGAVPVA